MTGELNQQLQSNSLCTPLWKSRIIDQMSSVKFLAFIRIFNSSRASTSEIWISSPWFRKNEILKKTSCSRILWGFQKLLIVFFLSFNFPWSDLIIFGKFSWRGYAVDFQRFAARMNVHVRLFLHVYVYRRLPLNLASSHPLNRADDMNLLLCPKREKRTHVYPRIKRLFTKYMDVYIYAYILMRNELLGEFFSLMSRSDAGSLSDRIITNCYSSFVCALSRLRVYAILCRRLRM